MDLYEFLKRILDILGSLVGIILFSPIMLTAAVFIKIASPGGPILADIPSRVSKGKDFKMFKFRSMIPNAHKWLLEHPEWHEKYKANNYKILPDEDPRFIKGAKFMRKYSIDELPQFFNVLFGTMSLVGPRAYYPFELIEQGEKYPDTAPFIEQVKLIKPGITGVWQISGRSKIGFVERIQMDAAYAKRRSILYDLVIILKTPFAVLAAKGAN
jgi:lipopolysaccharide/colanic/teichoic acid biosynthesis glycosyltransferase